MIHKLILLLIFINVIHASQDLAPTTLPTNPELDACSEFFKNLTTNASNDPLQKNLYMLSGHNLNDLGDYDTCISLPNQKYSLLLTIVDNKSMSTGVCGPQVCNISQLQNQTQHFIELIANFSGQNISGYQMIFVDPEQGVEPQKGFWLYFTCIMLAALVAAAIAGTIMANRDQASIMKNHTPSQDEVVSTALLLKEDRNNQDYTTNTTATKSTLTKVLESFDLVQNFNSIIKNEENTGHDQNLAILNGLRSFAFFSVVYGHIFLYSLSNIANYSYIPIFMDSPWLLTVFGALYAVDTFFYIGGFLTGFLMLSKLRRMPFGLKNYLQILFHRLIRLWPAYFVAILFYWKIAVHMGNGPLWNTFVKRAQFCSESAWQDLIFLNNFITKEHDCFSWGWYLACDFQVFLVLPFLCWAYIYKKNFGKIAILSLLLISITASYLYSVKTDVPFFPLAILKNQDAVDFMSQAYPNPLVRMSVCMVGLWLGFTFKEYKEDNINIFTWIKRGSYNSALSLVAGLGLLVFVMFYPRVLQTGSNWSDGFAMTWNTFGRLLWAAGLFLLTAPCLVGNLKFLRWFLSGSLFIFITKVSYGGYLLHLVVLYMMIGSTRQFFYLSESGQFKLVFLVFVIACLGSVVLQLLVEKPVVNLEAKFLSPRKPKKQLETGKELDIGLAKV